MAAIRVRFDDMENMSHQSRIMQLQQSPEAYQSKRTINNDAEQPDCNSIGSAGTISREARLRVPGHRGAINAASMLQTTWHLAHKRIRWAESQPTSRLSVPSSALLLLLNCSSLTDETLRDNGEQQLTQRAPAPTRLTRLMTSTPLSPLPQPK